MSRHSSSSALTRRSSASTVISASRYETNAPAYRDFGISGVPDDAVGEYLKEARQKQSKFIHSCALKPECPVHSYYVNSHYLSVCQYTFWEKLDVDHYRDLIAAVFQRKAVVMPAPVHRILPSKNHYYVPLVS